MTYGVHYDRQPIKFLKKLEKDIARRILDKLDSLLADNPVPSDAKRIVGEHGVFRVRVGDYRAVYRINYEEKKVIIFRLDKRSRIY